MLPTPLAPILLALLMGDPLPPDARSALVAFLLRALQADVKQRNRCNPTQYEPRQALKRQTAPRKECRKSLRYFVLPLLGSNQDSSDPESDMLPVTPRGSTPDGHHSRRIPQN